MLRAVAEILSVRASEGWLVGGSVRDRLLGHRSPDLDVVVADDAAEVARQLAAAVSAPWFALSDRYPTYRVLSPDGHVDLTAVRGGGILADLAQRDFTINAMAVPLAAVSVVVAGGDLMSTLAEGRVLLDPFGGADHLRQKRLVAVSDRIFVDDSLRLMRAARFCHTLALEPDAGLLRMIKDQSANLSTTAAERIVNEMCITLAAGRAAAAAGLWSRLGLLQTVLPEAPPALLDCLDEMLADTRDWFPEHADFLRERLLLPVDGAVTRPVALRLAGLMWGLTVEQTQALGRRLKLSGALVSLLVASARSRGSGIAEMLADGEAVSRRSVLFLWDAAPWEPEAVMLRAASDAASARAVGAENGTGAQAASHHLMDLAVRRARGELAPLPFDGEGLMEQLGLDSGPAVGRALREARLAWESGEATSRAELLAVARRVAW